MTRSYTIREVEQLLTEDMAPQHRELMQFMLDELRVHNNRAWAAGVQTCVDIVKQRHAHYELYRCTCLDRDPGNGHVPGCKGEVMSTSPATFAILDEVHTFLSALLSRGPKQ